MGRLIPEHAWRWPSLQASATAPLVLAVTMDLHCRFAVGLSGIARAIPSKATAHRASHRRYATHLSLLFSVREP